MSQLDSEGPDCISITSSQRIMENPPSPITPELVRRRVTTRPSGKKTMKWDSDADQQLLLAILAAHEVKVDSEAVAARLGQNCTPRAVVERLKRLKKQATAQDDSAPFGPMTKPPPPKKKKVMPVVNDTLAADRVDESTQVQVPATSASAGSTGNGFGEAQLAEKPSIRSIAAGDNVEGNSKSGKRLMPVKHESAVGNSYIQSAIDSGPLLLEERNRDRFHKVQVFSSSKMPQPFLDR